MNFYRKKDNNINNLNNLKIYKIVLLSLIYVILGITVYIISYSITTATTEFDVNDSSRIQENSINDISEFTTDSDELPMLTHSEHEYLLKEINGKIAIYKSTEYEPFMILDVFVSTLPYVDRHNLIDGITVSGDDELRRIIEDFDS